MFNFFGKKTSKPEPIDEINTPVIEDYNDVMPIADYFKEETGVTFENQQSILKSKLISFCKIRHIPSFQQCLAQVKIEKPLKQELINYLTTNESYFYREQHQILDLVEQVKGIYQTVDILCAPSSTGEEIYSIAIALVEAGIPKNRFKIIGVDINSEALKQAELGIYNQRNISNLPETVLIKYFNYKNSKYYLNKEIKQCVHLKTENIFSSTFKTIGTFDFIFSRNMLIYFDRETKIKAKSILENLLKDRNGVVYYGHADLF